MNRGRVGLCEQEGERSQASYSGRYAGAVAGRTGTGGEYPRLGWGENSPAERERPAGTGAGEWGERSIRREIGGLDPAGVSLDVGKTRRRSNLYLRRAGGGAEIW